MFQVGNANARAINRGALLEPPVSCGVPCSHCKKYVAREMLRDHLKDCRMKEDFCMMPRV